MAGKSFHHFKSKFPSSLSCLLLEVTFILYEKKVKVKFTNWVIQNPGSVYILLKKTHPTFEQFCECNLFGRRSSGGRSVSVGDEETFQEYKTNLMPNS